MRRRVAVIASLALLAAAPAAWAYDFAALDSIMTSTAWGPNGATMIVQQDTTVVYERSVPPMTPTSVLPIASASKWLSAGAFMTLVDSGLVSLDDRVSLYLPLFTGPKGDITIRQLWSHTSGLPGNTPYATDGTLTLALCVDSIALRTPLVRVPGTAFIYGQTSMQVAGRIAEVVSGQSWESFFQSRIAAPLGMHQTSYGSGANPLIAGGARASALDYARYVAMIEQGGTLGGASVLSPASIALMQRDQTAGAAIVASPYGELPGLEGTRYGLGEWLNLKDPFSDRAFVVSSTGAFGFTPWVSACNGTSGVIATLGDVPTSVGAFSRAVQVVGREIPDSCIAARLAAPAPAAAPLRLVVAGANPSRGAVSFRWTLAQAADVRLEVFDLRGARVVVLARGRYDAGAHASTWAPDAALPPGLYRARLEAGDRAASIAVVRVR
jgi:CubicO group peptidase (beta-lactamase class C family)